MGVDKFCKISTYFWNTVDRKRVTPRFYYRSPNQARMLLDIEAQTKKREQCDVQKCPYSINYWLVVCDI